MPKTRSIVFFNSGKGLVEAEVTKVNEDGSLNILYPHPADASVRATAENVQEGTAPYQWSDEPGPAPVAEAPQAVSTDGLSVSQLADAITALSAADKKQLQAELKARKD